MQFSGSGELRFPNPLLLEQTITAASRDWDGGRLRLLRFEVMVARDFTRFHIFSREYAAYQHKFDN